MAQEKPNSLLQQKSLAVADVHMPVSIIFMLLRWVEVFKCIGLFNVPPLVLEAGV